MSETPFTPPSLNASAYNCPFCNAYAKQVWSYGCFGAGSHQSVPKINFSYCTHCGRHSVWYEKTMVFPDSSQAPLPNNDLPDEIKNDYEEARQILNRSPRGAAALLRLCIQKLFIHLGESGSNINNDIASLVKKGLNPNIQKSLDIVRVIGNEAVHPGTLDLKDNINVAIQLCKIVNFITDAMITQPKMIEELYDSLPEDKKNHINKRDGAI